MNAFRKMMALIVLGVMNQFNAFAQVELQYYLPEVQTYDANIPTPASVIGHEIGDWHVTHDKLVYYFNELAESSSKVTVEQLGKTYEDRPILNVIITSEENHQKLEQLRIKHLQLSDPASSDELNIENMPVVVRLGYSVHGNEASGANASLLVAYHLAASGGEQISKILDKCIILIDPSLNPDGLQRFATWVNEHKSKNLNNDLNGREFSESWPNGRTNHYWFDLNRDWLLIQHPESIARLKAFHDWRPNVQTDHHEMGSEATFFFQPGIPSRKHPLIPQENVRLTEQIARFHAETLDNDNRLYYTKESFDDFYFGKGSTYPDIHGAIGILFEQASVRGHLRKTQHGELSFPFAIKNQLLTSLSTIEASLDLRIELLQYQRKFYSETAIANGKEANRALIVGTSNDAARTAKLGQVLLMHQIKIHRPTKDITIGKQRFLAEKSFIIPLDQHQSRLIKAIFEKRTSFQDSLFYDVSAWNFDLAYNTQLATIENVKSSNVIGEEIYVMELTTGSIKGSGDLAYVVNWDQYYAPGFLNAVLKEGLRVKVATEPFIESSGNSYARGSLLIPVGIQEVPGDASRAILNKYAKKYHIEIDAIESGLFEKGPDMGSNKFKNIRKPEIAMIVGNGASGHETGEVWHLLDQRYDMNVTMISTGSIDRIDISDYNTILMPGGYYTSLGASSQEKIKNWVKNGGTLVASRDALRFVSKLQIADLKFKKVARDTTRKTSYADLSKAKGAQVIGGAIFEVDIDNTHPLAYGYSQNSIAVFKRGTLALEPSKNYVANPFVYSKTPLISGYSSKENIQSIADTPAVSISSFGQGKVIAFVDNYNFRAFWYGTNHLYMNSIFFGDQIVTR